MNKIFWLVTAISCLIVVIFFWSGRKTDSQSSPYGNPLADISVGKFDFRVEVVSTEEKTRLGLSGRESMCEKCGMLFVFKGQDQRSFWMKDMKFDLDIIWISENEVVYVEKNVQHERGSEAVIRPKFKADKVLELNSGSSEKFSIKPGDHFRVN